MEYQWFYEQLRSLQDDVFWRRKEFADINYEAFSIDLVKLSAVLGSQRTEFLELYQERLIRAVDVSAGIELLSNDRIQRFVELADLLTPAINQIMAESEQLNVIRRSRGKIPSILLKGIEEEFSDYSRLKISWSKSLDFVKQIGTKPALLHIDIPPVASDIRIYAGIYGDFRDGFQTVNICDMSGCQQMLLDKRLPEDVFVPLLHACFTYLKPLERRISEIIRSMPDDTR